MAVIAITRSELTAKELCAEAGREKDSTASRRMVAAKASHPTVHRAARLSQQP